MTAERHTGGDDIVVELPAEITSVGLVTGHLRSRIDFTSPDRASEQQVAVVEIVTNAIRIHKRHGIVDPVEMRFRRGSPVVVSVIDCGPGFDVEAATAVTPHPERFGGRGLIIARAFAAGLTIDATPHGTRVDIEFDPELRLSE